MPIQIQGVARIASTLHTTHAQSKGQGIAQPESNSQTPFVVIGHNESNGTNFQKAFPNAAAADQWLASGAAADVIVEAVQPMQKFVA